MQNAPKLTINKIDKIKKEAMLSHCFPLQSFNHYQKQLLT